MTLYDFFAATLAVAILCLIWVGATHEDRTEKAPTGQSQKAPTGPPVEQSVEQPPPTALIPIDKAVWQSTQPLWK